MQMSDDSGLGGGVKYFLFSPLPRDMIQLTNIFLMGWFNHQLEDVRDLGLAKTVQPWVFLSFNEGKLC